MRGEGGAAEYFQHLYMGLGRAQRLDRVMIRNFPRADDGDLDWSILESGPPDYLIEFFHVLEKVGEANHAEVTESPARSVHANLGELPRVPARYDKAWPVHLRPCCVGAEAYHAGVNFCQERSRCRGQ